MRILPMGDRAVLVEAPEPSPAAWAHGLRELGHEGVADIVPAAQTVLVRCVSPAALTSVVARLDAVAEVAETTTAEHGDRGETVTIPVRYDGPDLVDVAERTGHTIDEFVARHRSATYRVAFCGFAPGFAYLDGLPTELRVSRRDTPRTRVPAGAVAIADRYAAVYPRESPGGWNLIGTTSLSLWDLDRDPPSRLSPGTHVRFEER